MKIQIQCNACETAEATVVCCADEAALCCSCDHKIHTANKLASKHQRVPLSSSSSSTTPNCDICQETVGYFFCLEDRALLCRKCDVAIHTANSYVSSHQRFLLTGVKVGLEATEPCASSTKEKLSSVEKVSEAMPSQPMSKRGGMVSFTVESEELMPRQLSGNGTLPTNEAPLAGGGTITIPEGVPEWCLDEYLGLTGFSQNYGVMDCVSSTTRVYTGQETWEVVVGGGVKVDHPSTNHNSPRGRVVANVVAKCVVLAPLGKSP